MEKNEGRVSAELGERLPSFLGYSACLVTTHLSSSESAWVIPGSQADPAFRAYIIVYSVVLETRDFVVLLLK